MKKTHPLLKMHLQHTYPDKRKYMKHNDFSFTDGVKRKQPFFLYRKY